MLHKCSLNRMKIARLTDAFDRCDFFPLVHRRKGQTRVNSAAIDMHRTSVCHAKEKAAIRAKGRCPFIGCI
jgi:hypothetical protein